MTTHGNLMFVDKENRYDRSKGVWLHAYSDGHKEDAFKMLKTLPEFFVSRVKLARELKDPALGKAWFVDQWNEQQWSNFLSQCVTADAFSLAALAVNTHLGRWVACPEEEAPWHEVGQDPDFIIVCDYDRYVIRTGRCQYSDSSKDEDVEVMFHDRIFSLLDAYVKSEQFT